jgi:hypothetical protein
LLDSKLALNHLKRSSFLATRLVYLHVSPLTHKIFCALVRHQLRQVAVTVVVHVTIAIIEPIVSRDLLLWKLPALQLPEKFVIEKFIP